MTLKVFLGNLNYVSDYFDQCKIGSGMMRAHYLTSGYQSIHLIGKDKKNLLKAFFFIFFIQHFKAFQPAFIHFRRFIFQKKIIFKVKIFSYFPFWALLFIEISLCLNR